MGSCSLEGLLVYIAETFSAGVIQSYQGQGFLEEESPIIERQDPLGDFTKFDKNDTIFQEYDSPLRVDSKMGWKRSRPPKWWMSLWKAMKCVFCIQILGGLALGSLAILILVLDFNSVDLCYEQFDTKHMHNAGSFINWNTTSRKIQAIMVTGDNTESCVIQMLPFLLILTMFGWPLVKKLNLLALNLLAPFLHTCYYLYLQIYGIYNKSWRPFPSDVLFLIMLLINSVLVGREIASGENERSRKLRKTIKISAILAAQLLFGVPLTIALARGVIPFVGVQKEIYRVVIAGALPLATAIPKVIVRLAAQRIDFLHPGDAHVLLNILYTASAIVFRVMQAELTKLKLFILLSLVHGVVDLLERLTIVMRDHLWYFIYKKVKRDTDAESTSRAEKFRTPRSMRFVADMSIQMILGESTALIAAVGLIELYDFMYPDVKNPSNVMYFITEFFKRVSIGLSIDFIVNSLSLWLQMSYLNIAVVRVWKRKWRKHLAVCLISASVSICFFASYLFAVIGDKHSGEKMRHFNYNCTGPFTRF